MEINIDKLEENQEFHAMFEITRNIIFEVRYYTLGSNKNAHFSTSANELNKPKSDYSRCGQAQEDLLTDFPEARTFYEKWDKLHLSDLNDRQYDAMVEDLQNLTEQYNSKFFDNDRDNIPFYKVVELSKEELKHKIKTKKTAKKNTSSTKKSSNTMK